MKVRREGGENKDMKKLHDVSEACELLGGISVQTLYRHMKSGVIAYVKLGRRTMFDERDIQKFAQRNRVEATIA